MHVHARRHARKTRGQPRKPRPNTWAGRVGARIEAARVARGLGVAQLAKRIGLARTQMYRIEHGASSAIVAGHIEKIAKVLKTSVEKLVGNGPLS